MEQVFDFNTLIDRRGTNCIKYDGRAAHGYSEDVLPL